jgi:hypothetical protein
MNFLDSLSDKTQTIVLMLFVWWFLNHIIQNGIKGVLKLYIILLLLNPLIGCGSKHSDQSSPGLTAATIPDAACTALYNGWHDFKDGRTLWSQGWNCGTRDGLACWYYIHYSQGPLDLMDFEDHETICK